MAVIPGLARDPGAWGGWIPAFAGMTNQSVGFCRVGYPAAES